ncbi:Ribonuclease HII [Aedoeadaptatus ivorii]|uniref:Ribonuclease HII n=1 Tax=Aedoeadaptatus ivorii TaxID=54006 RepID=A0A448V155_9FIRM|nr:ribonuclease HII [Peptoniphilus ivorii]VEJ35529.1 Ribonuclease HII [Peptoniphilus ivorii]
MTGLAYDLSRLEEGYDYIAGVDEVGRGCLFGDVVAACVVMPADAAIEGISDSKKLSPKRRAALEAEILSANIAYGIGRENADTIDAINIKQATRRAMKEAVENMLDVLGRDQKVLFLVDAETIDMPYPQTALIRGDSLSYAVAAASILAKEYRDRLCLDWDASFPGYGIKKHKGYGTKFHREAILSMGPSALHRKSFLKKLLK